MSRHSKKPKLRQATESTDGSVAVLCYACRRSTDTTKQVGLASFFTSSSTTAAGSTSTTSATTTSATTSTSAATTTDGPLLCSRCRCSMEKKVADRSGGPKAAGAASNVLPHIARLRNYQRVAADQRVPFAIPEHAAAAMMREPCIACGSPAPIDGHGLTRLRFWPEGLTRPERGGFMGPFHPANVATACAMCNLMKGYRSVRGYVEACRHVATHRGGGWDFGRYPNRFRDNVSKRSRSCYITASSTHSKTHALSNEVFARIVARPCRYCGKASDPPRHHNGLDRIDSSVRVYTEESCDSCCGDCNIMKYTHSEADFIACCVRVATHNVGRDEFPGDVADGCDEDATAADEEADASTAVAAAAAASGREHAFAGGETAAATAGSAGEENAGASGEAAASAVPNPFAEFACSASRRP